MRVPLSWLREYAALPDDLDGRTLAEALIKAGLEVETVDQVGAEVSGPLVIGKVLAYEIETHSNGKSIRWCQVDVGPHNDSSGSRSVVCGAHNFEVGDIVVVALPGTVLPGRFAISARKTYGHVSDGMICSARELGLGDDHAGILVLAEPDLEPGSDAAPLLELREDVLDIAVTADRGYCLSIRGIARESAQALEVAFADPVNRAMPVESTDGYPVELLSDACPIFVALTVTGIDPNRPSPRWLARRVQLAGMRSISLAVDITNYVMLETGQPIHAYDAELLDGAIVVRKAAEGEKLTTLDDVVRPLHPEDLLITDSSGPIGLAGVMGGATTELSASTRNVVIEAAHFDAMTIARTSRRHKLSSEASRRFERGVDPEASYSAATSGRRTSGGTCGWHAAVRADRTRRGATSSEHRDRCRAAGKGAWHRCRSLLGSTAAGGRRRDRERWWRHAHDHTAELAPRPQGSLRLCGRSWPAHRVRDDRANCPSRTGRPWADQEPAGPTRDQHYASLRADSSRC